MEPELREHAIEIGRGKRWLWEREKDILYKSLKFPSLPFLWFPIGNVEGRPGGREGGREGVCVSGGVVENGDCGSLGFTRSGVDDHLRSWLSTYWTLRIPCFSIYLVSTQHLPFHFLIPLILNHIKSNQTVVYHFLIPHLKSNIASVF